MYNLSIGKYGKPVDTEPYSALMLEYEYSWNENLQELNERAKELFNSESMETGMFAKGGSLKGHGLAIGDEIVNVYRDDVYVYNRGVVYMLNLSNGKRTMTKMTKSDAISTFAKGGSVKTKSSPCDCLTFLNWYK